MCICKNHSSCGPQKNRQQARRACSLWTPALDLMKFFHYPSIQLLLMLFLQLLFQKYLMHMCHVPSAFLNHMGAKNGQGADRFLHQGYKHELKSGLPSRDSLFTGREWHYHIHGTEYMTHHDESCNSTSGSIPTSIDNRVSKIFVGSGSQLHTSSESRVGSNPVSWKTEQMQY